VDAQLRRFYYDPVAEKAIERDNALPAAATYGMTEDWMMRRVPLLAMLVLAGCSSNGGTTRNFVLTRDGPPQSVNAARMPLSAPCAVSGDLPNRWCACLRV